MVDYSEQKQFWNAVSKRRSPDHPAVRAFAKPKVDLIVKALYGTSAERPTMLEVGAGSGFFSILLDERFDLTCSDFSQTMLDLNPIPAERKVLADAEALEYEENAFDVVFSANLLHHMEDPLNAVSEMRRVASKHVVLIEPNTINPAMFLFNMIRPEERGAIKFTSRYLRKLARRAGLSERGYWAHGSVVPNKTPPAMLPMLQRVDGCWPFALYHVGVFDV